MVFLEDVGSCNKHGSGVVSPNPSEKTRPLPLFHAIHSGFDTSPHRVFLVGLDVENMEMESLNTDRLFETH